MGLFLLELLRSRLGLATSLLWSGQEKTGLGGKALLIEVFAHEARNQRRLLEALLSAVRCKTGIFRR